ncbi:MAG: DUF4249 domain-containing protein [Fulvivirga sp.]|uniref:DUF4249 domain-containing protein n=1 Tax=Fulvivirga sp. TaxID=1931237 RepID=UPI0032F058D8
MRSLTTISLSFILVTACIDPIDFETDSNADGNIVIDALITDKEESSRVIISKSVPYSEYVSNTTLSKMRNAHVVLSVGSNELIFREFEPGTYIPPADFKAIDGLEYKLTIELEDGKRYESDVNRLTNNADIETVRKDYTFRTTLSKNNVEVSKGGVELLLDTKILDDNKYYRWQFTGTYQIESKPELVTPVPPTCSGIDINPETGIDEGTGICTCCICWVTESENLILSDPSFRDGQIKNVPIAFIENSEGRFEKKYHYAIDQIAISQEEYEFWRAIKTQKEQGSLFAQQVGKIPSNINEVGSEQGNVLGYFSVASITSTSGYLTAADVPERISVLPTLIGTCLGFDGATNIKPPFWE